MKSNNQMNIKKRLVTVVILAVSISLIGYFITFGAINSWIDNSIYTKGYLAEMSERKLDKLENYINEEAIKAYEVDKIIKWQNQNPEVVLYIFVDDKLIYDTWEDYKFDVGYESSDLNIMGYESYGLSFTDHNAKVFIQCKENPKLEKMAHILCIMIWASICVFIVIHSMGRNIKEYRQVDMLSHDLKTPLTSIMLYAELLEESCRYGQDEAKYFDILKQKSNEMKNTIDNILYMKKTRKKKREWIPSKIFFSYQQSEFIQDLIDTGYCVEEIRDDIWLENKNVLIDFEFLKLLYNNILVNIYNYADKTKPVNIKADCVNGFLRVAITNFITEKSEGTGYGTGICEEIMSGLRGCYKYDFNKKTYKVELFFTVKNKA